MLRCALAASLAATTLLTGCEPDVCEPSTRTVALQAPYNQFFNQLPACDYYSSRPPVAVGSSNGLTDSFSGSCVDNRSDYSTSPSNPCETISSDQRSVYYRSSLYGFNFSARLIQHPEGARLQLDDQSAGNATAPQSAAAQRSQVAYSFATGQAELQYYDAASNAMLPFGQAPEVTELANYSNAGRTYAQVWRITNPLNANQGRATAVTAYFIDRDYGLIRFEQRDGTVWSLTH